MHNRADEQDTEVRGDMRTARGLRLRSLRLGLTGKADVVEFYRCPGPSDECIRLEGADGLWRPVPVEYKRGRPKVEPCDEFQLCAQALCLEEMMGVRVPAGVFFYGMPRRRYDVAFDAALREQTEELCARLHALTGAGKTPKADFGKKCGSCSLNELCMPKAVSKHIGLEAYLASAFIDAGELE